MNSCCTNQETSGSYANSHYCPVNGKTYSRVTRKALLHHIAHPWSNSLTEQAYYFCTDPNCNVVYFGHDNSVINSDELRTVIWQKSNDENANLCYCFGISKKYALTNKDIKHFVIEQTKNSLCSCESSNPSGLCCLKDFPK